MDHPRDSVWIEPLEASTLSVDEETDTQTPVSVEGSMNWFYQELMVLKQVSFLPAIRAVQRQCSDVSWSGSHLHRELLVSAPRQRVRGRIL